MAFPVFANPRLALPVQPRGHAPAAGRLLFLLRFDAGKNKNPVSPPALAVSPRLRRGFSLMPSLLEGVTMPHYCDSMSVSHHMKYGA